MKRIEQSIYIPSEFWMCKNPGLAIPGCAIINYVECNFSNIISKAQKYGNRKYNNFEILNGSKFERKDIKRKRYSIDEIDKLLFN